MKTHKQLAKHPASMLIILVLVSCASCARFSLSFESDRQAVSLEESSFEQSSAKNMQASSSSGLGNDPSGLSEESHQTNPEYPVFSSEGSSMPDSSSAVSSSPSSESNSSVETIQTDSSIVENSQEETSQPVESVKPEAPSTEPSTEDSSVHVHQYDAQQKLVSASYDELVTVTDRAAWDETITVTDSEPWDEVIIVTDKEAWDETVTVMDQEAYDETITIIDKEAYDYVSEEIWGTRCRCGEFFPGDDGSAAYDHMESMWNAIEAAWNALYPEGIPADKLDEMDAEMDQHSSFSKSREEIWSHAEAVTHTETIHHDAVTHTETIHYDAITHEETVHHPACTHTEVIHHPAITHEETVHHEAVYETIYVCSLCGSVQ